jgi:hypothetical protein
VSSPNNPKPIPKMVWLKTLVTLVTVVLCLASSALAHPEPVTTDLHIFENGQTELIMTGQNSGLPILSAKVEAQIFPDDGSKADENKPLQLKGANRLERVNFSEISNGKYTTQLTPRVGAYIVAIVDSTFSGENAVTAYRITLGKDGGRSSGLLPQTKTPVSYVLYALLGLAGILIAGVGYFVLQARAQKKE